ncbi:MAG: ABC-F family ATP-binding cassette domain-containing protein [Planctomycetes bacterium]|nr:ABC-F family ATP-binding cassette domain-containing protein [Planctomycetota bacterium]
MLTLTGVTKSYGERILFADAALQVLRGDRIGLVGPNGAGKSTLFSLILGDEAADDGRIAKERDSVVGWLPQESAPVGDESAFEIAVAITPDFIALRRKLQTFEQAPGDTDDGRAELHERWRELAGHLVEAKARRMLGGLGFRDRDMDRPARELSGGWVMRAHLARLLTQEPDLLMLDEPTNHLDLEALLWLQDYLRGYPGAILVISHDREFLNALVTAIVEIRHRKLVRFTGNWDRYVEQRDAADAQQLAAFQNQQKEIAHLQAFVDRFRAKASKATQAQSKLKQIERMEKVEAPQAGDKTVAFAFPQPIRSGQRVCWLQDVHFAYGETPVYRGVDLEIERGQRVVLVGPNGAGKSTLLKLLAGRLQPQRGERGLGHNVVPGFFSQYRVDTLQMHRTVLEEALDTPAKVTEPFVRTVLGSFLFSGDSVFKRIEVLSGGEKSRLALVKLLLDPPNLLLMDEPTTHLDMASIDALVGALEQFGGTTVFISHDVHFIRSIANHVLHVANGKLTHYHGDWSLYLHKTRADSARAAVTAGGDAVAGKPKAAPGKSTVQLAQEQRKALQSRTRSLQQKIGKLETQIESLETRKAAVTRQLEDPACWQDGSKASELSRDLEVVESQLAEATAAWEAASLELEQLQRDAG